LWLSFGQEARTQREENGRPARAIRLNTNLARKPLNCLEYIVVHEMIHILDSTQNDRFLALMSHLMPDWSRRRQVLNQLPVRHENRLY